MLWVPPEPEWLRESSNDVFQFLKSLREPEDIEKTMADEIVVTGESGFAPAPEGQHLAVCVDVVDLGERVESFQGGTPKITKKVALVFQLADTNPDTGESFEASIEKTIAFGQTAGLRKFLSAWRGKAYSDAEAAAGVPLAKLVGVNAIVQIEHRTSKKGRIYATISNIMPPMKNTAKLAISDYLRSEHWALRRADYAEEVLRWRSGNAPQASTATTRNGQPVKQSTDLTQPLPAAVTADSADDLPF
jgi:hypothetical protein